MDIYDKAPKLSAEFLWDDFEATSLVEERVCPQDDFLEQVKENSFKRNARMSSGGSENEYPLAGPQFAAWDCRGLTRLQVKSYVKTLLNEGVAGEFVIRDKDTESGYALTAKLPEESKEKFATFLIGEEKARVFIKGTPESERFDAMADLVEFYSSTNRPSLGLQLHVPVNLWGVSPSKCFLPDDAARGARPSLVSLNDLKSELSRTSPSSSPPTTSSSSRLPRSSLHHTRTCSPLSPRSARSPLSHSACTSPLPLSRHDSRNSIRSPSKAIKSPQKSPSIKQLKSPTKLKSRIFSNSTSKLFSSSRKQKAKARLTRSSLQV
eukprot:m.83127 g.83127  ORF g.83127 m.83127 type:complete len:322 (-) comp25598_c1_seq1:30-995(-)